MLSYHGDHNCEVLRGSMQSVVEDKALKESVRKKWFVSKDNAG